MVLKALARRVLPPWDLDEVGIVFHAIGGTPGTMLDVGAHQGYSAAPFLVRKWTVHAFEPDPKNRAILTSRFPNITIDPRAVSENDGDEVSLFTSDVSSGISTLSPFHTTHEPTATVRTVRLDTYIREQGIKQVDFLKIDTEGYDLFALRTFPWDTLHPKAVVCEFEDNKTTRLGHDVHEIARFIEQQGYSIVVSEWEPITQYGVRHTWRRFARYPTELDADSWGNLIAVEPSLLESIDRAGRSAVKRMRLRQWAES